MNEDIKSSPPQNVPSECPKCGSKDVGVMNRPNGQIMKTFFCNNCHHSEENGSLSLKGPSPKTSRK